MVECKYEVTPFPSEFCRGCFFNGCYPWNRNPLLFCSRMGGIHLSLFSDLQCLSFELVTKESWKTYVADMKNEAKYYEEVRRKAMDGTVLSNQPLPGDPFQTKLTEKVSQK